MVAELVEEPKDEDYRFPRPQDPPVSAAPFPAPSGYGAASTPPPQSGSLYGSSHRGSSIGDEWEDLGADTSRSLPPRVSGGGVRGSSSDPALGSSYGSSYGSR